MASFTDTVPQFNPFVDQLPIDAMVKVGTYKQEKYEQGIQKIQGYIDNIAGLDVYKDIHKEYLQSKLNELGNNLTKVAGGDFSNFQLVNSVSGMASQIIKDPTIQNAVSSTAKIRKNFQAIETAKKEGKSSIQNETWFNNELNNWANDGNLNSSYSGEYVQYTDMEKKLRDVAEKVHEADNSIEIPFKRDNLGNVLYYKTDPSTGKTSVSTDPNSGGVTKIDDAILSIKTKGKSADKILSNFYDSLDENDKRQLKIDGWYHYRGKTKKNFVEDAKTNYDENRKMLSDKIVTLNTELQTNPKLTSAEKSKIQAVINDTNKTLSDGTLEKDLQKQYDDITAFKDVEEYKYKLYTQKFLTNLAKDISYQDIQQEYKANPYEQADNRRKELQFKYDDARRQQNNWERNFQWEHSKFYAEQLQKAQAASGSQPVTTPGRLPTDIDTPSLAKLEQEITDIVGDPKKGIVGAIGQLNSDYASKLTNDSLKTPEQKLKYLNNLSSAYATDPSTINSIKDPNVREYLEKRRAFEILAGQKRTLYKDAVDKSAVYDKKLNDMLASENGIVFKDGSKYSAKELYDFDRDASTYYRTASGGASSLAGGSMGMGGGGGGGSYFDSGALMKKYRGTKYEGLAKIYSKHYYGEALSPGETVIWDQSTKVGSKYREAGMSIYNEKQKFQADYLAKKMPERQTQIGTLSKDNKIDMDHVDQLIGNKIKEYSDYGAINGLRNKSDFDPATVGELQGEKDVKYNIEKKYDGSANLTIFAKGKTQIIPMTSAEFAAFFPNYHRNNPINDIKYVVLASPNHTTNLLGGSDESAAVNAYMSGYNIPNLANTAIAPLVRLDVEGSPYNDGGASDGFVVRMYVNTKDGWKTDILSQEGYISEAAVQQVINNIGPTTVSDLLKKNP